MCVCVCELVLSRKGAFCYMSRKSIEEAGGLHAVRQTRGSAASNAQLIKLSLTKIVLQLCVDSEIYNIIWYSVAAGPVLDDLVYKFGG